jgi:hypothetical protein
VPKTRKTRASRKTAAHLLFMRNYRFNDNLKFDHRCTTNPGNAVTTEHVSETDARVAATGILDKLTAWRREDNPAHRGNNPRALVTDRAILVGLLLLASERRGPFGRSISERRTIWRQVKLSQICFSRPSRIAAEGRWLIRAAFKTLRYAAPRAKS